MLNNVFNNILSKAKIRIKQSVNKSSNSTQILNMNLILSEDKELMKLTKEIIDVSSKSIDNFKQITEYLKDVDASQLDPFEQSLVSAWLKKVVASYHIKKASEYVDYNKFEMIMFDTSLYDQPP